MIFSVVNAQEIPKKLKTPPYLHTGDTIAIVAPSGIIKNRDAIISKAIALAESWGLQVFLGENLFNQNNHFAGTDEERTADFQKALNTPSIKAIWAGRGGYGSVRILDKLNFNKFKKHPKWIIGYSDITTFHNHIHNLGIETIHGMMPTNLEEAPATVLQTISSLKNALFGKELQYSIPTSKYNRINSSKKIQGQLIGGNLAIMTSLLGSNSQLSTAKKILFIEEVGEYKYSIDRMLQSLKRAGYFTNVSAVIIGNISLIKNNSIKWGGTIEELILDVIPKEIPVLFDFPAGHGADNMALIMGRSVKLVVNSENYTVFFNTFMNLIEN